MIKNVFKSHIYTRTSLSVFILCFNIILGSNNKRNRLNKLLLVTISVATNGRNLYVAAGTVCPRRGTKIRGYNCELFIKVHNNTNSPWAKKGLQNTRLFTKRVFYARIILTRILTFFLFLLCGRYNICIRFFLFRSLSNL